MSAYSVRQEIALFERCILLTCVMCMRYQRAPGVLIPYCVGHLSVEVEKICLASSRRTGGI